MCPPKSDTASTKRWVASKLHNSFNLFDRINLWDDNPIGPEIQCLFDWRLLDRWNANERRGSITYRLQNGLEVPSFERPVFTVNEQPIEPQLQPNRSPGSPNVFDTPARAIDFS